MQVLLQYRLIVIQNCRLNYTYACARANVKTLRPTFQLSNLAAVDGGLGLWLSLGVWDFW